MEILSIHDEARDQRLAQEAVQCLVQFDSVFPSISRTVLGFQGNRLPVRYPREVDAIQRDFARLDGRVFSTKRHTAHHRCVPRKGTAQQVVPS